MPNGNDAHRDELELGRFIREHFASLCAIADHIIGDRDAAQDIAQEENVDISTIYKDHKLALRQLSALFFGYFE